VIDLEAYRSALAADEGDEDWNALVPLAEAVWSWREPESIDALEACVARLRAAIRCDWEQD